MIFLGNNSMKTLVLFVLELVIGGGIFFKWFKIAPIEQSDVETNNIWQDIGTRFGEAWQSIAAEIDLNKFESKQTWEEFQRQNQEEQFIQDVKSYLAEHSTSTYSTSTDQSQDEGVSGEDTDNR